MSLHRAARWVIRRLAPADWCEPLAGDLEEERRRRQADGRYVGMWWALASATSACLHLRRGQRAFAVEKDPARPGWMAALSVDLRQAVRSLGRRPVATVVALVTLTVGLASVTAAFSLANWLMFRPVPGVTDADEIVTIKLELMRGRRGMLPMSVATLRELARLPGLSRLAGAADASFHIAVGDDDPVRVEGAAVTSNYFDVLGQQMLRGRSFGPADDEAPRSNVAIVSERFWRVAFGGRGDVVGRSFLLNGHSFVVVGVAAAGFRGPDRAGTRDVWVPIASHRQSLPSYPPTLLTGSRGVFFSLVARLDPGATVERVDADAKALRERLVAEKFPGADVGDHTFNAYRGVEVPFWQRESLPRMLTFMLAIAALLLVLATANVTNLLLAHVHERRVELATRQALGASRLRLVGQLTSEAVAIALASGLVALACAALVGRLTGGLVVAQYLPALAAVPVDWRVFLFAMGVSLAACLAATVGPALSGTRVAPAATLATGGRSQAAPGRGVRRALSVIQVATAVTLVAVSALLVRSLIARYAIPLGYDPGRVLAFSLEPGVEGHDPDESRRLFGRVMADLRNAPGIEAVGAAWVQPFKLFGANMRLRAAGQPDAKPTNVDGNYVSAGFFPALGAQFLSGRDFTEEEGLPDGPSGQVVILNESAAKAIFGRVDVTGEVVEPAFEPGRRLRVVGVVADMRTRILSDEPADSTAYEAFTQPWGTVHVRVSGRPSSVLPAIRAAVRRADPTLPLYDVERLSDAVDRHLAEPRLVARTAGVFASLAVIVAGLGLYSVMVRGVEERRREFGIRAALGAGPGRIIQSIALEALGVTLAGAAAGGIGAVLLARSIQARLYGVSALDPVSIGFGAALAVVLAALAVVVPARRAAHLDVMDELR